MRLREQASGMKFPSFAQIDEDFCDDIHILVEKEEDFVIVDNVVAKFESVSGAILNRNRKSKVMGLGGWTGRTNWPLPWLKSEPKLKIYGFIFKPRYKDMLIENWDISIANSKKLLWSWDCRALDTL